MSFIVFMTPKCDIF